MSVTLIILVITVAVSLLALNQKEYLYRFEYIPYLVAQRNEWYRCFTHALVHADYFHMGVNMYVLYMFGQNVEAYYQAYFGDKAILYFILLYVGGIMFAALPGYRKHQHNPDYRAVGASGAISAVLFTSILFEPTRGMGILFIPFHIPAVLFGGLYLYYEWYMDKKSNDNIAHDAHFWGAMYGIIFTIALDQRVIVNFFGKIVSEYL